MSETKKVTRNVLNFCLGGGYEMVCANAYVFGWESDVYAITKKGYAVEFEVKISKADFKKDFEKEKHLHFKGIGVSERKYIRGYGFQETGKMKVLPNRGMPSRFYYVCPTDLIKVEEIPKYAGLIYVDTEYYGIEIVKTAPRIHSEKVEESIYKYLCKKMSWRLYKAQSEIQF